MFHDENADTDMCANRVKRTLHCFLEPNVDEGITALEVIGISVNKEIVP